LLVTGAGAFFFVSLLVVWTVTLKLPSLESFEERVITESTKIYDRTGEVLLYDVHLNVRRTVVPLEMISDNAKEATIAIEDKDFYTHNGIQPRSIFRAVLVNLSSRRFSQGGSTLTQQVVKNTLLTQEKTITRKLKEWLLALKLERILEKDEILALYLNETPYGGNIYGIEEASRSYFGKKSSDLTIAEAAYLAALPRAPSYYSPYGNNRDRLEDRKNLVLREMKNNNLVTEEEYAAALAEKVVFKSPQDNSIKAPHFVMYIKDYLEEKYGEKVLEEGGLKVTTSLDWKLQEKAEGITKKFALENETKFNAENAAMVALDPSTGQILVMIGSRDYFDENIDGNYNVTTAHRQPGSAFKPIVYAAAFNKGYTPDTVLFDLPTEFSTTCSPEGRPLGASAKCYHPVNYDNTFKGPMTLRSTLAESRNIPSIKVLYLAGMKDSINLASTMGVTTLGSPNQYGLTLVLGGGEVTLLELTGAYGVFANEGIRNPTTGILKIEDSKGNVLEEFKASPSDVLPRETALKINDVLSDNNARSPLFGEQSLLYFPSRDVAAKTGTTNDYRDAWILGYTPNLVVGAWAGNNDNSSMEKKVAGLIISPMWNAFMTEALNTLPVAYFNQPSPTPRTIKPVLRGVWAGGQSVFIDKASGKLATEHTPIEMQEERIIPGVHTILSWVNKDDPLGPPPVNPTNDPQFRLWEYSVREWVRTQGIKEDQPVDIPTDHDDVHSPENAPLLTIVEPDPNDTHESGSRVLIKVESLGSRPIVKAEFFLNDRHIGSSLKAPFEFAFTPRDLEFIEENNTIRVIGYDSVYNKGEATAPLRIRFPE
ncbi:MAG: PBP1A family penicillin-binding protein, partial [bacterium]|nr:PBP1A family penicillin-binding protein [bacterium]